MRGCGYVVLAAEAAARARNSHDFARANISAAYGHPFAGDVVESHLVVNAASNTLGLRLRTQRFVGDGERRVAEGPFCDRRAGGISHDGEFVASGCLRLNIFLLNGVPGSNLNYALLSEHREARIKLDQILIDFQSERFALRDLPRTEIENFAFDCDFIANGATPGLKELEVGLIVCNTYSCTTPESPDFAVRSASPAT